VVAVASPAGVSARSDPPAGGVAVRWTLRRRIPDFRSSFERACRGSKATPDLATVIETCS